MLLLELGELDLGLALSGLVGQLDLQSLLVLLVGVLTAKLCRLLDVVPAGPLPMMLQDGTSLGTITITEDETTDLECHAIEP